MRDAQHVPTARRTRRSKVTIRKASADVYAATIDDKVAMKIGPGDWSPNMVGAAGGAGGAYKGGVGRCQRMGTGLPIWWVLLVKGGGGLLRCGARVAVQVGRGDW